MTRRRRPRWYRRSFSRAVTSGFQFHSRTRTVYTLKTRNEPNTTGIDQNRVSAWWTHVAFRIRTRKPDKNGRTRARGEPDGLCVCRTDGRDAEHVALKQKHCTVDVARGHMRIPRVHHKQRFPPTPRNRQSVGTVRAPPNAIERSRPSIGMSRSCVILIMLITTYYHHHHRHYCY
jgi:hypothetical protein